jgi:hypothetical protein
VILNDCKIMETATAVIEALERAPSIVVPLERDVPPSLLKRPAPFITPYDPGQSDPDDLLLGMDLEDSLRTYADDRRRLAERLRELSGSDWKRMAEHGEYSHYSVFIMFRHVALHDFFHAYRIEELLLKKEWTSEWQVFDKAGLTGA